MVKCFYNKLIEIMEVQFLVFSLNLEVGSNENDDCDSEILLHFEAANKEKKIFKLKISSHSLNF